jgi:acetyltransferase-like isoleucine patch superfamily enzyme
MIGSDWVKLFFRLIGCKIGKGVFINTKGLHDSYLLKIGDNAVIGGDVNITCHIFEGTSLTLNNITVGDNTLIGAGTYIMPGARIGSTCSIGAYSVVRKNRRIDDKSVIMPLPGLPMRQIAKIISDSESK